MHHQNNIIIPEKIEKAWDVFHALYYIRYCMQNKKQRMLCFGGRGTKFLELLEKRLLDFWKRNKDIFGV